MGPGTYRGKPSSPVVIVAPAEKEPAWYENLFKKETKEVPQTKDFTEKQESALDKIMAPRQARVVSSTPSFIAPSQPTSAPTPRPRATPPMAPAMEQAAPQQADSKGFLSSLFSGGSQTKPGEYSTAREVGSGAMQFLGNLGNNLTGNFAGNRFLNDAFAQKRQEYADRDPNSNSSLLTRGIAKQLGMPIKGDESAYDLRAQMPYVRDLVVSRAMNARGGGVGAPTYKAPTESQAKAKSFADRMSQSQSIIDNLEAKAIAGEDGGYHPGQFQIDRLPERAKTESRKSYEQAQRTFINAALRRESGAVISPEEAEEAAKQYFPQSGDSVELLKQKQKAREIITRNMQLEGAPAGDYESSRSPSQSIMQDKNGKKYRVANGKVVGEL